MSSTDHISKFEQPQEPELPHQEAQQHDSEGPLDALFDPNQAEQDTETGPVSEHVTDTTTEESSHRRGLWTAFGAAGLAAAAITTVLYSIGNHDTAPEGPRVMPVAGSNPTAGSSETSSNTNTATSSPTESTPSATTSETSSPSPTDLPSATTLAPSPTVTSETSTPTSPEASSGEFSLTNTFQKDVLSQSEIDALVAQYPSLNSYLSDNMLDKLIVDCNLSLETLDNYKAMAQKYYKNPKTHDLLGDPVVFNQEYIDMLTANNVAASDMLQVTNDRLLNAGSHANVREAMGSDALHLAFLNPENFSTADQHAKELIAENKTAANPEGQKRQLLAVKERMVDGAKVTFVAVLSSYPESQVGPARVGFDWLVGINVGNGIDKDYPKDDVMFPSIGEVSNLG